MHPIRLAALVAAFFVSACEQPLSGAGSPLGPYSAMPVQSTDPQLQCGHRDAVLALMERFGERLQSAGVTSGGYLAEAYANPESGTWTWVITRPDGLTCLWSAGQGWRRAPDGAGGREA